MPELRHRKRHLLQIALLRLAVDSHHTLGLGKRQTAQEKILYQTKDGRVHADAEREAEHRDSRKSRRFTKLAQSEAKIIHVIQCATLEWDRHAWHDAPEENRQGARRRPASRSKRGG